MSEDGSEKVEQESTISDDKISEEDGNEESVVEGCETAEELQESNEEPGNEGITGVVNCIKVDILAKDDLLQEDEESSRATTPLERSQEISSSEVEKTEADVILKEWNSLINLLIRIPVKAQKGLSSFDLKLTCISTISDEILLIGTNVGIVYWYNRRTDALDRLRCEGLDIVTSLSCISTVDYMVAAGNQAGLVTIFQIPRVYKEDRNPEIAHYERQTKKSQRFLIKDLHKGAVTALEWSSNGMKLFSGDQTGHIVLTDIDYDLVQIRSSVLLCENYEIVQLSYARKNLLICSTFRSIIYSLANRNFNQVGSSERKVMGKYGGLIVSSAWEESPKVYSVRPGGRLWDANLDGVVQHTVKYKELILSDSQREIHVIKSLKSSARQLSPQDVQFTRLIRFMKDYMVTYYKDLLYIVDARNTIVLGICKELRSVLDVAVSNDEIFILESSRNVIRLSAKPDKFSLLTNNGGSGDSSNNPNLVYKSFLNDSAATGGYSSNSSAFHFPSQFDSSTGGGIKNLPDIMSASISDFRFPQESINFLALKLKETSEKVIPKINPILNTIKTVIEADVNIEDGQTLLESGLPSPVIPLEAGDIPIDFFFSSSASNFEEPVYVPEPERFQKISNLPFEDVVVDFGGSTTRKANGKRKTSKKKKIKTTTKDTASTSDIASDTVSVSSTYSNTSGSDNTSRTGWKATDNMSGTSSQERSSDPALSSSNSGSETMSTSEHSHLLLSKDKLGFPIGLSQSWSVGTLIPNRAVTKEELHLKEELLARRLKWPELLPDSVSPDVLFDELLASPSVTLSPEENTLWELNIPRKERSDISSVLTLVEPQNHDTGETTDTDSKTLTLSLTEESSSFGTVIERKVITAYEADSIAEVVAANGDGKKNVDRVMMVGDEFSSDADDDEDEDKYYMDIYTRYRSKDSNSISSFNSVLSFGPPSGSSYISTGTAGALGTGSLNGISRSATPSASVKEELTNSKDKSGESVKSTEEMDSIVESKVVSEEQWRRWKLPVPITQISVCDNYIVCIGSRNVVYYANLDGSSLQWKSTNYSASALVVSPCGTIVWRIYRGDLYSLMNISMVSGKPLPVAIGGNEQWSKLSQKRDVVAATVQQSFGWIVKQDGSLEFCTGLLETRLIPYFEKVYTPWPLQNVACSGHKLWALTTDGRIVFRIGTSTLNPRGNDWLEVKWSSNDIPPACSISCGEVREEDGLASVWFSDENGKLYFTYEEMDSRGRWVPWKVSINPDTYGRGEQCKSVILSSIKDAVNRSMRSLGSDGSRAGLKQCSSKHSVWFTMPDSSILCGNRTSITGHYWSPLRVDRGTTVPLNWTNIYANSIYQGHGNLWISDSNGNVFYLKPSGGKLQQIDLPMFTDGRLINIAPAPEALWALTTTGDIHGRCGITSGDPVGKTWSQISLSTLGSAQFTHISCGSEVAWAVDDRGEVYMRIGNLKPPGKQDMSPAWNKVESSTFCNGKFTKVYVGGGDSMVWALDSKKRVYARQAVFPDFPIGTGWLLVKGIDAVMLSISDSAVWALSPKGDIYRRNGISKTNFVGDYWRKIPGNANAITVSLCDELWALTTEGYLLKHSNKVMKLRGWGGDHDLTNRAGATSNRVVLDEEDEDWELVDNSEI